MSTIKQAFVMLNGTKILATYSEETKLWTAEGNAPAQSSWSQPNHVFTAAIHVLDAAGNEAILDSSGDLWG